MTSRKEKIISAIAVVALLTSGIYIGVRIRSTPSVPSKDSVYGFVSLPRNIFDTSAKVGGVTFSYPKAGFYGIAPKIGREEGGGMFVASTENDSDIGTTLIVAVFDRGNAKNIRQSIDAGSFAGIPIPDADKELGAYIIVGGHEYFVMKDSHGKNLRSSRWVAFAMGAKESVGIVLSATASTDDFSNSALHNVDILFMQILSRVVFE